MGNIYAQSLIGMLIVSRVDEAEAVADGAAAEQTILGGREPTNKMLIVTMSGLRHTTMSSNWWARMKSRNFGKPCAVTCRTALDSRALKGNPTHAGVYGMD
jgi:hypothetical protein